MPSDLQTVLDLIPERHTKRSLKMSSQLKLKMISIMAVPEHWKQFTALAHDQGLSISALLRQVIAREVRRAAQEAARTVKAARRK
jgi:hypothetical protein